MKARNLAILQALGYVEPQPEATGPTDAATSEPADDPLREKRVQAAQLNGLPPQLADRLRGDSPAAISLDAQRLARSLQKPVTNAGEKTSLEIRADRKARQARSILPGRSWSEAEGEQNR